jgi:hypothetical protein
MMFPHFTRNRGSTGGSSSSYSGSDAASSPLPHPGGHLDQRGNDCTMSGTTAISGLSSPTAVENDQENTKTSFSRCKNVSSSFFSLCQPEEGKGCRLSYVELSLTLVLLLKAPEI